jgi:hypothetical protein
MNLIVFFSYRHADGCADSQNKVVEVHIPHLWLNFSFTDTVKHSYFTNSNIYL